MNYCHCGHHIDDHYRNTGRCQADTYRPELGRSFGCFCPQFEADGDDAA